MEIKKRYCFCLTEQQHEDLLKIAKREHRSVSNLLEAWIAEHKDG